MAINPDTGTLIKSHEQEPKQSEETVETGGLKDTTPESLSAVFKSLVEEHRQELKAFHPTLLELNRAINAFHQIGLTGVTLEIADFEVLGRHKRYRDNKKNEEPENVTYALLGIYNAAFVVRIHPDFIINCHAQNMNSGVSIYTNNVADHRFWYKTDKNDEPEFFQYNLKEKEDCIAFANSILQAAAARVASDEFKEYNVTSSRISNLTKVAPPPALK